MLPSVPSPLLPLLLLPLLPLSPPSSLAGPVPLWKFSPLWGAVAIWDAMVRREESQHRPIVPLCCRPCPAYIVFVVLAAPPVVVVGRSRAAMEAIPALGCHGWMRVVPAPPNSAVVMLSLSSPSRQCHCRGHPLHCCPHPNALVVVAAPRIVVPVPLPSSSWPPPVLSSLFPLSSTLPVIHPCPQTLLKASNDIRALPKFADCCVATKNWVGNLTPG